MIVVVHRTTCTNVDSIQCTNYDDMQQSKSMHKLWYTMQQSTISFAGIFRPYHSSCFCQSVTIVIIILNVQQYNCRRTTCTNVDSIQASWQDDNNQNQCTTYDICNTTINHPFCRDLPTVPFTTSSYWMYHNTIALLGVVSRLFVFV